MVDMASSPPNKLASTPDISNENREGLLSDIEDMMMEWLLDSVGTWTSVWGMNMLYNTDFERLVDAGELSVNQVKLLLSCEGSAVTH